MTNVRVDKPMSICLVIFHAFPQVGGGEERFLEYFSNFLTKLSIRFTIVSSIVKSNNPCIVGVGIKPFRLPFIGFTPYSLLFSAIASLKIILMNKRRNFSLIHSIDTGYAGLAGLYASKILGLQFFVHSHCCRAPLLKLILLQRRYSPRIIISLYGKFESFIDRLVSRNADMVIAVSNEIKQYISSLGVSPEKIVEYPMGLNVLSFEMKPKDGKEIRQEFGISLDAFVIGYIGRVETPSKNIGTLIKAFSLFQKQANINSHLLIVGNNGHKKLQNMVREMRLSLINIPGFRRDVKRILAAIDVFVLPSLSEGCPFSLIEAMAAGKAIIASNIPSIRKVVEDGKEALLFDPRNFYMLKQAFLRLYYDQELREKLRKNAKRKAQQFNIDSVLSKILEMYKASQKERR